MPLCAGRRWPGMTPGGLDWIFGRGRCNLRLCGSSALGSLKTRGFVAQAMRFGLVGPCLLGDIVHLSDQALVAFVQFTPAFRQLIAGTQPPVVGVQLAQT